MTSRTALGLVAVGFFTFSCGANVFTRDTRPENEDPTGLQRLEREAAEVEVDEDAKYVEDEAPSEGMEVKDPEPRKTSEEEPEEKHAISAEGESVWSSGSAEGITDRARRQLRRRCDAGSKAACRALPALDRCDQRKAYSCAELGTLYEKGADRVRPDLENARDFWMKSCQILPRDCVRFGKRVFAADGLRQREQAAEAFFRSGCTREFDLCVKVGKFYDSKNKVALAGEFYRMGCEGGSKHACERRKK